MFYIHTTPDNGFIITRADDDRHALYVDDLSQLLRLRARLNDYIDTQEADGALDVPISDYITSIDARDIAAADGYTLALSTLNSACKLGIIQGARKNGGRWEMPRADFEDWYRVWRTKQR